MPARGWHWQENGVTNTLTLILFMREYFPVKNISMVPTGKNRILKIIHSKSVQDIGLNQR